MNREHLFVGQFGSWVGTTTNKALRVEMGTVEVAPCHEFRMVLRATAMFGRHIPHIVGLGAGEQMISSIARWVVAVVQDAVTFRDRTYLFLVGKTMSVYPLAGFARQQKNAVASLGMFAHPGPTAIGVGTVYPQPEAITQGLRGRGRGMLGEHRQSFPDGATPPAVSAARGYFYA